MTQSTFVAYNELHIVCYVHYPHKSKNAMF